MKHKLSDPFADFKELDGFDIYAGDGHYHHAAAFDKKTKVGKTNATGHFFRLDLRSHHLGYLDLGVPDYGKKRTHDITVIRGTSNEKLRNNAKKGQKIIYAWDKASIDYRLWSKLKNTAGIYFITREKSNSAARICSVNLLGEREKNDPRNEGIEGDYYVGNNNGETLRRIYYTDPRDGRTYTYLTNEMTLPAYIIVLIYKVRWNIEKVFDQLKNKMEEKKSWASSETAKRHHAIFECLTHNLCLLMEEEMKCRGLEDEVENKKRIGREETRKNRDGKSMAQPSNFIGKAIQRCTQRTVRFIRWLQCAVYNQSSITQAIEALKRVWCLKKS